LIPNGGIAMVRKNQIRGTVSYPPGGDKALQLALDILNKKEVDKYNYLSLENLEKLTHLNLVKLTSVFWFKLTSIFW